MPVSPELVVNVRAPSADPLITADSVPAAPLNALDALVVVTVPEV